MNVDSLAPALARADRRRLEQYLIPCPGCGKPAAAHVDLNDLPSGARPVLVRLVCPDACVVAAEEVLGRLPVEQFTLSA